MHNLTEVVARLAQTKERESTLSRASSIIALSPQHMDEDRNSLQGESQESSAYPRTAVRPELLEILGDDPNASNELKIQFNAELKNRWQKWMQDGFPIDNKKSLMQKYPKKGDFYTEAPKVNPEVSALMTEISVKRDKHFEAAQNCVGSALSALGAAVSLILEDSEEGIDQESLTQYLCAAGKLMSDVFYQQTVARKSFITPTLNKTIRPTLEATKADEWLYGSKFVEKVNEVKSVEKACVSLKVQEKPLAKLASYKYRDQGNSKLPPAKYKQVGNYTQRPQVKFKNRYQQPSRNVLKPQNRKPYQSSRK